MQAIEDKIMVRSPSNLHQYIFQDFFYLNCNKRRNSDYVLNYVLSGEIHALNEESSGKLSGNELYITCYRRLFTVPKTSTPLVWGINVLFERLLELKDAAVVNICKHESVEFKPLAETMFMHWQLDPGK